MRANRGEHPLLSVGLIEFYAFVNIEFSNEPGFGRHPRVFPEEGEDHPESSPIAGTKEYNPHYKRQSFHHAVIQICIYSVRSARIHRRKEFNVPRCGSHLSPVLPPLSLASSYSPLFAPLVSLSSPITDDSDVIPCLVNHLQAHYRAVGKTASQVSAQKAQLIAKLRQDSLKQRAAQDGDANGGVADFEHVDESILDMATGMQLVETVPLLMANAGTEYEGISMYVDDSGLIKQLPVNMRATQIAHSVGNYAEVRGDAFVARTVDHEAADIFRRLDFSPADLSSSASWMTRARAQWHAKNSAGATAVEDSFHRLTSVSGATATPSGSSNPRVTIRDVTVSPSDEEKEKGNRAFKAQQYKEAITFYSRAVELDPSNVAAINNRAMAYIKLTDYVAALADCEAVLAQDQKNVKALLRRGACREAGDKKLQAHADYAAVLESEPRNKEALAGIERCKQ